ncbi:hypothetical protein AHAS_Ahas11G0124200 [Arachis hypogaea]
MGTKEELEVLEQDQEVPAPSKIPMKMEVVEAYKPKIPYSQRLQEVANKHEKSLPKEMQNHAKEREESNQGSPHSNESGKYRVVNLIEPSI